MNVTLLIVLVLVVTLSLAVLMLRMRKVRRFRNHLHARPIDARKLLPPSSPYEPAKGFRLLQGTDQPSLQSTPPARPRLDANRHYVFNEMDFHAASDGAPVIVPRHNSGWALERSRHRSRFSVPKVVVVALAVVVLAVLVGLGYLIEHHRASVTVTTLTTTTSSTLPVTSTTWPTSFQPTSVSGDVVLYDVLRTSFNVIVNGSGGPLVVDESSRAGSVKWHGIIKLGQHRTFAMKGFSTLSLSTPSNAAVLLNGTPVVLPSKKVPTLTLNFVPSTSLG